MPWAFFSSLNPVSDHQSDSNWYKYGAFFCLSVANASTANLFRTKPISTDKNRDKIDEITTALNKSVVLAFATDKKYKYPRLSINFCLI